MVLDTRYPNWMPTTAQRSWSIRNDLVGRSDAKQWKELPHRRNCTPHGRYLKPTASQGDQYRSAPAQGQSILENLSQDVNHGLGRSDAKHWGEINAGVRAPAVHIETQNTQA